MEEEVTTQEVSDNQEINTESLLGTVAAPSVQEIEQIKENTTVNEEVSETFGMEQLLNMMDEDLRAKKTWEKFKNPVDLAKSYTELEKLVGKKGEIPSDEDDKEIWSNFYLKLGKPESADKYELDIPEPLKNVDGVSDKVNKIKEFAHEANLSNRQAQTLFKNIFDMEAQEVAEAERLFSQELENNKSKLQNAWGQGVEQMSNEVKALEERLGVYDAFEQAGLNNNADLLIALGKLASDLRETSTIEMAVSTTPQGLQSEIAELNAQATEYMRKGQRVPAHLQAKINDAFKRLG